MHIRAEFDSWGGDTRTLSLFYLAASWPSVGGLPLNLLRDPDLPFGDIKPLRRFRARIDFLLSAWRFGDSLRIATLNLVTRLRKLYRPSFLAGFRLPLLAQDLPVFVRKVGLLALGQAMTYYFGGWIGMVFCLRSGYAHQDATKS